MSDADPANLKSKLAWRCRRGTKELDCLLSRFLEDRFDQLSARHQAGFALLLEQQDPLITDWIWGRCTVPQENSLAELVAMIRADARIQGSAR